MTHRTSALGAVLAVLGLALPIYLLRLNNVAGMMGDDAWYTLLAKSLADGTGYKLVSSPGAQILPLYPPGFPALLSFVFHGSPNFPENVVLLKGVSIAAMMAVGLLTLVYLRDYRLQPPAIAGGIALSTATVPAFVFVATSTLMSECLFTAAQLCVVVLLHRSVESSNRRPSFWLALVAAVFAAAAVLIRSAAVGLIAAVIVWLIVERLSRRAAVFASVVAICLLPWITYSWVNAPTPLQRAEHGGAVVYTYGEQLWMRWAGAPTSGRATVGELPARVASNLADIATRGVAGIFVPAFLRGASESGEEVASLGPGSMGDTGVTQSISIGLSIVVLVGFMTIARQRLTAAEFLVPISVAIIALWPFWSFRFLLPLAPFLFLYLVTGVKMLTRSARAPRIAVLCILALYLYDHAGYILEARQDVRIEWIERANEVDAALEWIGKNVGPDGAIASTNSALLYLKTGHQSLTYDPTLPVTTWKTRGFRYLISLRPLELPAAPPEAYKVLYQSPGRLWVIEL